jgi:hypothetical protein
MKAPSIAAIAAFIAIIITATVFQRANSGRDDALKSQITNLQAQSADLTRQNTVASEKIRALEAESAQLRAARALSAPRLAADSPTPAPDADASPTPASKGGFLSKMLKDPAMRKMIAAQQAGALRGFYADFVKGAHMTPDQADQFFKLLADRQEALMDSSVNMVSGSQVDMKAVTAATNTANDAIKSLLGQNLFDQYQGYEKTLGDRIQVQQFSQQIASTGAPLQDYQSQQLIQIMSQEQASQPAMPGGGSTPGQGMSMTQEQLDQYSQQVDAMNQRVYNRAMSVLTPAQLTAFATFQKNMATAQMAGLKMAQQMFKGDQ